MSGIEDVARRAGVSIATVSRALRGLPNVAPTTRSAVERAAEELGYVPSPTASALSSGRHNAVAVVLPTLGRWFYTAVVDGAERVLRAKGFDVYLINLGADGADQGLQKGRLFHSALLRRRADAVLALGVTFSRDERRELRALSLPTVIVGATVRGVRTVGLDEREAGALAMDHLLDLGHRRIGHVGGVDEYGMMPSVAALRRAAWEDALRRRGIEPDPALFVSGAFVMPTAKVAARSLLSAAEPPTALFCGSDEMAFGAMLAAEELGMAVPRDLSVIGVDDHAWSGAYGLTTVRQDPYEQGELAAEMLLQELGGTAPRTRAVRIDGELVVRRTTAPPASRPSTGARTAAALSPAPLQPSAPG